MFSGNVRQAQSDQQNATEVATKKVCQLTAKDSTTSVCSTMSSISQQGKAKKRKVRRKVTIVDIAVVTEYDCIKPPQKPKKKSKKTRSSQ